MPDNFTDLYALPAEVTTAIKNYALRGFSVRVDGSAQVALFTYDNGTFIVESFLPTETDVKVSLTGNSLHLKNLVTGEILDGKLPAPRSAWNRQNDSVESRVSFTVHLLPHSYAVFAPDKTAQAKAR